MLLFSGCNSGTIRMEPGEGTDFADAAPDVTDAGATDGSEDARAMFEAEVLPLLDAQCVACHGPDRTGPAFLAAGPDVYTTVTSWPALVDRSDPGSSRILTKGAHAGPAWNAEQGSVVRAWLELEGARDAGEGEEEPLEHVTPAMAPVAGFNAIDLAELGMSGSSLTFSAERVGTGLYLSDMRVAAGPGGVRLVHPLVITWVGETAMPDPVDRLAGVEIDVPAYGTAPLGGGTFVLVEFPEGAMLSFHFDEAGPSAAPGGADGGVGDGGAPIGGCSNVSGFTANARSPLSTNCVRCHGGGDPMAQAAVDMSAMDDLSATAQQRSCDEILTRINRMDPANSPVFLQPDPLSGATHPFKFGSSGELDAFRSAVLFWLATED